MKRERGKGFKQTSSSGWSLKAVTPEQRYPDGWPHTHTPLGIVHEIEACGIFPPLTPEESEATAQLLTNPVTTGPDFSNYASYKEHEADANAELDRGRRLGFAGWAPKRETLEAKYGPLTPSRVGVSVKEGEVRRVRLIHDLSRSGVNHRIRLPERLVLPRLSDAMSSIQNLLSDKSSDEEVELLAFDFKDAFKHLHAHQDERPFLSGTGLDGWIVYLTVLFGVVSGPLVWGRVAALVMRATQALFSDSRGRLQCYVDDPILAIRGTPEKRAAGSRSKGYKVDQKGVKAKGYLGIKGVKATRWIGSAHN